MNQIIIIGYIPSISPCQCGIMWVCLKMTEKIFRCVRPAGPASACGAAPASSKPLAHDFLSTKTLENVEVSMGYGIFMGIFMGYSG